MPTIQPLLASIKYISTIICLSIAISILYSSHHNATTTTTTTTTTRPPITMAWRSSGRTNAELITNLHRSGLITSPRVRDAMLSVDRAHYTPDPRAAYEDSPQLIGHGATISAPHMHASAVESLEKFIIPAPASATATATNQERRVLDVGSGSGYLTHVLANMVCGSGSSNNSNNSNNSNSSNSNDSTVTGTGRVVGVDHIQGLVELARTNMRKSDEGRRLLESRRVEFVLGDGRKGWPALAPYDAIHVGAAAAELHQDLLDQLKSPGRMFIPVEDADGWGSQWIWVVDKDADGKVTRRKDMAVRYVPLTDRPRDSS